MIKSDFLTSCSLENTILKHIVLHHTFNDSSQKHCAYLCIIIILHRCQKQGVCGRCVWYLGTLASFQLHWFLLLASVLFSIYKK